MGAARKLFETLTQSARFSNPVQSLEEGLDFMRPGDKVRFRDADLAADMVLAEVREDYRPIEGPLPLQAVVIGTYGEATTVTLDSLALTRPQGNQRRLIAPYVGDIITFGETQGIVHGIRGTQVGLEYHILTHDDAAALALLESSINRLRESMKLHDSAIQYTARYGKNPEFEDESTELYVEHLLRTAPLGCEIRTREAAYVEKLTTLLKAKPEHAITLQTRQLSNYLFVNGPTVERDTHLVFDKE